MEEFMANFQLSKSRWVKRLLFPKKFLGSTVRQGYLPALTSISNRVVSAVTVAYLMNVS